MAVNNLNWAILHTERAKHRLEGRAFLSRTTAGFEKARQGAAECEALIATFKESQGRLKKLIHEVGISRTDNPTRTRTLMNGRRGLRLAAI